nr:MAG TPA: hypothetical protein [Caudoviricetes sp.]
MSRTNLTHMSQNSILLHPLPETPRVEHEGH